ncbi:MAG: fatty acid hydroxylase family protein, partial [Chromatiales bacterium]|nr:fatty acid hydroxylase family protein [Chromatiales bacterium]
YHTAPDSWVSRLPGMQVLRQLHTRHHDPALMQRYNFNISYPICDALFGTLYRHNSGGAGASVEDRG